jgi:hypothetical protein
MKEYLGELGPEDAVVMEASCGSFYWAERVEATGSTCFVLDPMRFRIITDCWNKTERQDACNMAKDGRTISVDLRALSPSDLPRHHRSLVKRSKSV